MALERPEESDLPATAPNVLEQRQEADAPSLERVVPRSRNTSAPNTPPPPKPKTNGEALPVPQRETRSLIDTFRRSLESTGLSSKANTYMVEARKAELKGDKERALYYKSQAAQLYGAADEKRPEITSVDHVDSWGDAGHLAANFFGSATPSVLTSIAAGTLGGVAGRYLKPALTRAPTLARNAEAIGAGGATSFAMHDDVKGSIIAQQEADPVISQMPVEQRERAALATTGGSLALESLIPGMIGYRASRKLGGGMRRDLSPEDLIKSNRGRAIENIGGEGLTELSQTALEEISLELQNPDRPNAASASEYIDSLLGGFAGGAQGHGFGRSLEGVGTLLSQRGGLENAFTNYKPVNKQSGHISSRNIQNQRIAQNELFFGTGETDVDVFGTFMPDVTSGLKTYGLSLHDLFNTKKLEKVGDPELAKRMQAAGILAMTIDNPEIADSEFQNRRQYVAKVLFPGYAQEDALEIVDSIFDTYVDANAETSSSIAVQDTPETSEENIEYREDDLVIEGFDEADTFENNLSGDPTNLSIKLKASDVQDVWARPEQAARPSKSETSVIHRPAFNNAPWEMDLLNKEVEADGQAEVEPITDWLSRHNHDPVEYAKLLLEDLSDRRDRNRQDPQAILEEKGADTEGKASPYTQEEVVASLDQRIKSLGDVIAMSEQEGSPRAVVQHLKNNYSKGAVKSVNPSQDLALSPTDLKDFSKLNRRISGKKSRERAQEGRIFPLVYANGKDDTNGYAIHPSALENNDKKEGGWVAESIIQTMAAKGRSGRNILQSGSKRDDFNERRMLQEGLASAMASTEIVGFLNPKSVKKGKVVGPIEPYVIRRRDKAGKEVGEARMAIPDVPINTRWQKAADPAITRETKYQKGDTLEAQFNAQARDAAKSELENFDKSANKEIAGSFKASEQTGILEGKMAVTKRLQDAMDSLLDAVPSVIRKDLRGSEKGNAFQNVLDYVSGRVDERITPAELKERREAIESTIRLLKAEPDYNIKIPKNAEPNERKRLEDKKIAATQAVNKVQNELNNFGSTTYQELTGETITDPNDIDQLNQLSDEALSNVSARKDTASAVEYIQALDETIAGLKRRISGYAQDRNYIKSRIDSNKGQTYPNSKFSDKSPFELNTSDKARTFETVGDARNHAQKLYRAQNELYNIQRQLEDAKAAVDETLSAALEESTEGMFGKSAVEEGESKNASSLQDELTYDPAAKDVEYRVETSKKARETKARLTPPKEKITTLTQEKTPTGIPKRREQLLSKGKKGKRETQAINNMRVHLTDGETNSIGIMVKDLQASDIIYLELNSLDKVNGGSKNYTYYMNKIFSTGANIYYSTDSKLSYKEFAEYMDSNGYSRWNSDPNMFAPINNRIWERNDEFHNVTVALYKEDMARIKDLLENPGDSLDSLQAAQRSRLWGGKDRTKQARKEQEETGEVSKDTLKELRDELVRNQQEVEAAITNLSDFGSREAREAFYGYLKSLDFSDDAQRARNDLHRTIHGNRRVIARMKELVESGQYPLTKKDVARIQSDPDFAVAVAFQMWANEDLKITDTALGHFKRIITHLLNILGLTLSHQYGEQLFTAFSTGDLKTISDTRTVYRVNQRALDNTYNTLSTELSNLGRRLARGSTDVLRDTKVPELMKLADLFQVSEANDRKSETGFIPARRMMQGQFNAHLSQLAKKYTDNELEIGFEEFRTGNVQSKAGRAIRDLNTKLYKYMEEAGVKVLDKNYKTVSIKSRNRRAPIVFDTAAISKNRAGFVKTLKKIGLTDVQAEAVLNGALWDVGSLDLSDTKYDLGRPPNGSELYSGLLDDISITNRAELKEFERSDPLEAYYTFIRQATHRAEMTRHLGHNAEKVDKALEIAKIKGLSRDQVEFIRTRTIPSLMGTLSYNMNPKLRKIQGAILTMQNLAILPLALFASVVDIMGIPLRTGDMTDAWRAFKDGLRGIANSSDPDFNMAEILGINDGNMLYDRIGDTYNELIDSPWLRKINHKFFLINGLEGWTRGMRVSAMNAAIAYLSDHRDNAQKLEDIGLKKSDLTFTPEGLLDVENNRKVQEAIYKFVDSAVLRPSASHRPAWGSDPRFLLIWHLKQFTFSFHNVFYRRVANSIMEHGWKNATLIPFLSMIPIMVASDFARNIIAPSAHYESLNFAETVLRAIQRSSIAGLGTFGFDVVQDVSFDEYPGTSLLGPTFDSADKFLDSGMSSGLFRLTPGYALTKTWID